ncbi:MAG: hypothetical protein ACKPKO_19975, partial [Candidatus Fonsibacter sp.]
MLSLRRHKFYLAFSTCIQRLMLDIIACTRKKLANMIASLTQGTRGARKAQLVRRPFAPEQHLARQVRRCSSGFGCRQQDGGGWLASIPGYLEGLEWVEREPQHAEEGVSWLELLVEFEQCTGTTVRTAEGSMLDRSRLLRR